jgi:glycosyltransferase involved in cell wall biosynthesis
MKNRSMAERIKPMTSLTSSMPVVCHITTVHSAFDPRIFHKECAALVEAGYEVHLVAPHDRDETVRGVQIHALPRPRGRLRRMLVWPWKAYRRVLAIHPRPAIVHFHDPEFLPVGAVLRLHGFKVVYDVHENVADHIRQKPYLPPLVRGLVSLAYQLAERVLRRGMATVHVIESIAARYPEPKTVVRNLPQSAAVATLQRPGARRPRLVYVGAISRDRGAITMVQVAGTLARRGADFELRLVGPVYDRGLEDEIRAEASLAGVADRVTLLPPAPYERAMEEIAASDVGLCLLHPAPNYVNSLSVKILEYMQRGLPVVASDFACWREIVSGAEAGVLVDPLDVEKIADALVALLADPEVRREMGRRGREAVLARYNWDAEKQVLVAFYRRLLGDRSA